MIGLKQSILIYMDKTHKIIMTYFTLTLILAPQVWAEAILFGGSTPTPSIERFNYDQKEVVEEISDFWSIRKMAIGLTTAGTYGLMGGVIGFYFHPQWSVDLGYGGGSHFQSYGFRIKKMLLKSSPLNPYYGFGFHRWQRSGTRPFNSDSLSPQFLSRLLSDEDKRLSRVNEKLVHGQLGLQYTFTEGEWKGLAIFGEALLMMSVDSLKTVPTASVGFNYFF